MATTTQLSHCPDGVREKGETEPEGVGQLLATICLPILNSWSLGQPPAMLCNCECYTPGPAQLGWSPESPLGSPTVARTLDC